MSDTVKQLEDALKHQPANPLRHHQVTEYQDEADRLNSIVQAPAYVTGVSRGAAQRQSQHINKVLEQQIAKPLQGAEKDRVARLANEVMQEVIRPALLPREDMRRNPAGAVGRFLKEENSKPVKQAVQQWKRAMLAVEQGNPDPDLANIERFRPERIHDTGGVSTFAAGAQIPGNFAMTNKAKENWPLGEPLVDTPLKQSKRVMSEAQKAGLAKAQAARAAKRDTKEQVG